MMKRRLSHERGKASLGWLESYHTFSFASYFDPMFRGFRSLRVINEDRVEPGQGFGTHPHADMEILTYVISGALEHKDSTGTGSVIQPGDVQIMSAGTGIEHSEFNPSASEQVHLLQIWIHPARNGLKPRYQEKKFSVAQKSNHLCLIASRDEREGSVLIHQDVDIYASVLATKQTLEFSLRQERGAWMQVISGDLQVNGEKLGVGDGLQVEEANSLSILAATTSEFLLFDLGRYSAR